MQTVEMKELKGFSRYKFDVTNGKIYDTKREIWLDPKPNARYYSYVNLQKDDKKRKIASVHNFIYAAHIDANEVGEWRKQGLVVDHINGQENIENRSDNRIENLRLITSSKNNEGRKSKGKRKVLSKEELAMLHHDFESFVDGSKRGILHDLYEVVAIMHDCSSHTVQVKFKEWQKAKRQTESV